jgi:hypothetical protein
VSEAKYADMARVVDMTFGSGRFKCLGRTIAWIELNKIFVEVRWNLFYLSFVLLTGIVSTQLRLGCG